MAYNGREVLTKFAQDNGWTVTTLAFQPDPRFEWVTYTKGHSYGDTADVLIAWTPENTAPYVAIDGRRVNGVGALIEAHRHIGKFANV